MKNEIIISLETYGGLMFLEEDEEGVLTKDKGSAMRFPDESAAERAIDRLVEKHPGHKGSFGTHIIRVKPEADTSSVLSQLHELKNLLSEKRSSGCYIERTPGVSWLRIPDVIVSQLIKLVDAEIMKL